VSRSSCVVPLQPAPNVRSAPVATMGYKGIVTTLTSPAVTQVRLGVQRCQHPAAALTGLAWLDAHKPGLRWQWCMVWRCVQSASLLQHRWPSMLQVGQLGIDVCCTRLWTMWARSVQGGGAPRMSETKYA